MDLFDKTTLNQLFEGNPMHDRLANHKKPRLIILRLWKTGIAMVLIKFELQAVATRTLPKKRIAEETSYYQGGSSGWKSV